MPKVTHKNNRLQRGAPIQVSNAIAGGSSKIKKKIRDIERLLKRDRIPADVRIDNERALKALHVELDNAQHNIKSKNNAKKYHMVRFFERKKAIRRLKQANSALQAAQLSEAKKDIEKATKQVEQCQIEVAYIILFPMSDKYISLYPTEGDASTVDNKGQEETAEKRALFKKEVERLIKTEKLPFLFAAVLLGETIKLEGTNRATPSHEIDAPDAAAAKEEDDDFFE